MAGCMSRPSASPRSPSRSTTAPEIVDVPYDGGAEALEGFEEILAFRRARSRRSDHTSRRTRSTIRAS
jgi:hypothetical protein